MPVGMPRQGLGAARGGNRLVFCLVLEVIGNLGQQLIAVAIGDPVRAVPEELLLPTLGELVGDIIITEYSDLAQSGNFWVMVLCHFGTA
jgi:hypothetical protein